VSLTDRRGYLLLEFSSPNTNKPQHLGHVRNNCIGDSLSRLLQHIGYRVTKINLVNDRGIHICKSMLAWQKWGNGENPEKSNMKGDHLVGKYYVLFEKKFVEEYKNWIDTQEAKDAFMKWDEKPVIEKKNAGLKKKAEEETKKLEQYEKKLKEMESQDASSKEPQQKKKSICT